MIPVKHIDPDDIALYAMQLLPPDETEEMSLHLQHSAAARRVLSEVYSDLSIFAHSAEMHSPPALARQRLMKHVAREKKAVPIDLYAQAPGTFAPRGGTTLLDEEMPKRSLGARVLPWVGWALAAGLGGFSATQYMANDHLRNTLTANNAQLKETTGKAELADVLLETMRDASAVHFTLTGSAAKALPEGRVAYVSEKGSLVLMASNLEKLPTYKTYELWLIPQDGRDPIPAGTFRPDEKGFGSLVLPDLPKGIAAGNFAVTIEDRDGSQTPTKPLVLAGQAG